MDYYGDDDDIYCGCLKCGREVFFMDLCRSHFHQAQLLVKERERTARDLENS